MTYYEVLDMNSKKREMMAHEICAAFLMPQIDFIRIVGYLSLIVVCDIHKPLRGYLSHVKIIYTRQ